MAEASRTLFDSVVLRFADHIGAVSAVRAGPWAVFYQRHLKNAIPDSARRRDEIRSYVSATSAVWASQPMRRQEREIDGTFSRRQLNLLGHIENFPVNLMRRILGELNIYPAPDRVEDIHNRFLELDQSWARSMAEAASRFAELSGGYDAMVSEMSDATYRRSLTAEVFYRRLERLAEALPIAEIRDAAMSYLEARG